jgi:ribA/ribD-fused uncharacterized protein
MVTSRLLKYRPTEIKVHSDNIHAFFSGPLSQWALFPFHVYNSELQKIETFKTAEHYMMAQKAKIFKDMSARDAILKSSSPKEAKALGRSIRDFNEVTWNLYKEKIVIMGNVLKGMQNERFCQALLDTKDKLLIEASPYDRIWGVGIDENDRRINYPKQWPGKNLLGFCLMEVRSILKEWNKW